MARWCGRYTGRWVSDWLGKIPREVLTRTNVHTLDALVSRPVVAVPDLETVATHRFRVPPVSDAKRTPRWRPRYGS